MFLYKRLIRPSKWGRGALRVVAHGRVREEERRCGRCTDEGHEAGVGLMTLRMYTFHTSSLTRSIIGISRNVA